MDRGFRLSIRRYHLQQWLKPEQLLACMHVKFGSLRSRPSLVLTFGARTAMSMISPNLKALGYVKHRSGRARVDGHAAHGLGRRGRRFFQVGPTYVCLTFGTFVCTTCSGLHREFSHKVKVRNQRNRTRGGGVLESEATVGIPKIGWFFF